MSISFREYMKVYREKNRESIKEYQRQYVKKNKETLLQKAKKYREENKLQLKESALERRKNNQAGHILTRTKIRAKQRGIEFSITKEDIILPEVCPVFKQPFTCNTGSGKGPTAFSYSLDRIDNTKGYIPNNVQVISQLANVMKNSATPEQLLLFADWIYKTYGE